MAFDRDTVHKPTSHIVAPADPNAEDATPTTTFTSGMNAGSCYPGIGIATAEPNPKVTDWDRVQRTLIDAQALGWGGDSATTGQETADIPHLLSVDYEGADFNDTAIFETVDAASAIGTPTVKGDVINATSGAVLASDLPAALVENDWVWAKVPVV